MLCEFGGEGTGDKPEMMLVNVPKPVSLSWNKQPSPLRTGPQFTIFGTSTKTSLIHSTNSYGTLKSASIDSPGPPSKDARVLGDELTAMKGSESAGGLG